MLFNFVISLITINFTRKRIKTKEILPWWDYVLDKLRIVVFVAFIGRLVFKSWSPHIFHFLWLIVFSTVLYVLWILKENRIAKMLFWAGVPFVLFNTINDLTELLLPGYYKNFEGFFDLAMIGSQFWMLAFGIAAIYQQKAIEKAEQKNKVISIQNESLELLVSERTAEIMRQKEKLELTIDELKATQDQLVQKEKMASLGELTAGIAHEIQNPLNFVNNFAELSVDLAQELNEEIDREDMDKGLIKELIHDLTQNQVKINHHGKRASNIVKGMLEHSRTSTGEREMTDINALADEYLRLSYHGMRAKDKAFNADFKLDLDETVGKINVVPQDMGRVLLNLINNAFYAVYQRKQNEPPASTYTPSVFVSTKRTFDAIVIRVRDNGTGIPENVKQKIFQPFFTTKPTGEGTGLGLSLSFDIVTKGHGGELNINTKAADAENKGEGAFTEFTIILPI